MKIEIDSEEIISLGLTPCQYFYAKLIYDKNVSVFETFLEIEGEEKIKEDLYKLYQKGYIEQEIEEPYMMDFNRSIVIGLFGENNRIVVRDNFDAFFKEWYKLFPDKIMVAGMPCRSGRGDCEKKMKKFLKAHTDYSFDLIMQATFNYLTDRKNNGWSFLKRANYFIYKDNDSVLEGMCEGLLANPETVVKETNTNMEGI